MDPLAKLVEDALKVLNPSGSPLGKAGGIASSASADDASQRKSHEKPVDTGTQPPLKKVS